MLSSVQALPLGENRNAAVPTSTAVRNHVAIVCMHLCTFRSGTAFELFGSVIHTAAYVDSLILPLACCASGPVMPLCDLVSTTKPSCENNADAIGWSSTTKMRLPVDVLPRFTVPEAGTALRALSTVLATRGSTGKCGVGALMHDACFCFAFTYSSTGRHKCPPFWV